MNRGREAPASSQHYEEEDEDDEEEEDANLSPSQLLQLAETHLRLRNFSLCLQYALESQQLHDPNSFSNQRHASQLLAMSTILSSSTNYYSILQIDTFSSDFALIRSKFQHLLTILDPIKNSSPLAHEAVTLVWKAYDSLADPAKKTLFDSQISAEICGLVQGEEVGTFWTFCPYCFYVYQYARVYEGFCLRCQNHTCRRAFHGVAVNSLPRADLDKGRYFSCFGYFPLGFSPNADGVKFESWSPIVGLFPVTKNGKNWASSGWVDINEDDNDTNFVDESGGESENDRGGLKGENFGSNVEGSNAGKPRSMRRKSVAWNARKLMRKGRMNSDEGVAANGSEDYGNEDVNVDEGYDGVGPDDVALFEEGGEIFVEFGSEGAL